MTGGDLRGAIARGWRSGSGIVGLIAAGTLALHLAAANVYGLFIDELYFLACGEHLAWGYVDMPPLTAVQAWLARSLFGDSMLAIRLFPALAGAGLVLLAGALARELGGRRFAQGLAAFAVATAPGDLLAASYLSMNSIEPLLWMGCALVLLRIIRTGDTRLWLAFGLVAGIGLENKDTMLLFGFALVAGLLLTPERRLMANRWFLAGGAIAFLVFLPNLVWMIEHHFPHLEMLANIRRSGRNVELSPLQFMAQQFVFTGPLAAPIWLAGLGRLLAGRAFRPYRALGLAYVVTIAVLLALHGRVYYPLPAYAMLFAAGAVALEAWLAHPGLRWVKPAYAGVVALAAVVLAPVAMPLLPPQTYIRYAQALHLSPPQIEHRKASVLPQLFADRFGWPEMARAVAKAYFALPAAERARCAIFGNDYGEAGAIDFYGPALGLPKAISGHLTYWYWGPRGYTGDVMLVLGDRREVLEREFADVRAVAEIGQTYAMAQEHFTLYLCRKPKGWTLEKMWPRLKVWD
ncbi:MAG TPA: glycosyltransferase family 39 protein [Thermoanaerobaculaceae bacterium]|nr:glycosyltransferase family 39 protein [Thermoanaerobaculaceae bacterium]